MTPPRRVDVLVEIVKDYYREHGLPPSVREIGAIMGLRSSSTVQNHINHALALGLLTQEVHGRSRSLLPVTPGECPRCGEHIITFPETVSA